MFTGYLLSGDDVVAEINENKITPVIVKKLPLYFANGGDFEKWLESRAIDNHRPNSRLLKKVLRLGDTSDVSTVLHARAATITDDYWIKEKNSTLTYSDVRFKENIFADVALVGDTNSFNKCFSDKELSSGTPELTNIGSFEKCWRHEDSSWVMYKKGNNLELFSEHFVSKLAQHLGFDTAEYEREGDYIKTKDFTQGRYNFEPMASLVGEDESYIRSYDVLAEISPDLATQYLDILYVDTICMNMDRHTNNYGLLRDRATGDIISMAPNFDNNISLISRGYLQADSPRSNLLPKLFVELLEERNIEYTLPEVNGETLQKIATECDVNGDIDTEYVVDFVQYYFDKVQEMISEMEQEPGFEMEMGV